jgi:hypothetical protein
MANFWVVALYSLVEDYQHFRGACCLHHHHQAASIIALMMEAASTSEMSVNFYQTAQHNNPEDSHLHTHHHENLKSHFIQIHFQDLCGSWSVRFRRVEELHVFIVCLKRLLSARP